MRATRNRSYRILLTSSISAIIAICVLAATATLSWAQGDPAADSKKKDPAADQIKSEPKGGEESYIIGNTDKLSITFWQQPDLNREPRVNENGMISLPVIGEIKAAGLSTAELAKKIVQQMSIYNTPVSQATVTVIEFNSRSLVVTGEVHSPGTYTFEKIPDVWQVILAAGGPTSDADLSQVTVVRAEGVKSKVIGIDIYNVLKSGDFSGVPELHHGDLVNVPKSSYGTTMTITGERQFQGRNIIFVFGEVTEQGPRNLEEGMDVLDAIALAKGFTAEADLKNVRVIIKDSRYSNVVKINLESYTDSGRPPRMTLHPEDTIIVPGKRGGFFGSTLTTLNTIVPILGAVGTLVLLVRR